MPLIFHKNPQQKTSSTTKNPIMHHTKWLSVIQGHYKSAPKTKKENIFPKP